MTSTDLFWAVFAGALGANLLTVMFVGALVAITRRENQGMSIPGWALGSFLMPLLFCLGAFMIATDSVPAWLDAISK